jgi:hypothetical protein
MASCEVLIKESALDLVSHLDSNPGRGRRLTDAPRIDHRGKASHSVGHSESPLQIFMIF